MTLAAITTFGGPISSSPAIASPLGLGKGLSQRDANGRVGEGGLQISEMEGRDATAMGIPAARGAEKAKGPSCAPTTTSKSANRDADHYAAKIDSQSGGVAVGGETTAYEAVLGLGHGAVVAISRYGRGAIYGANHVGRQNDVRAVNGLNEVDCVADGLVPVAERSSVAAT